MARNTRDQKAVQPLAAGGSPAITPDDLRAWREDYADKVGKYISVREFLDAHGNPIPAPTWRKWEQGLHINTHSAQHRLLRFREAMG